MHRFQRKLLSSLAMLLWITDHLRLPVIAFVPAFGLQLCGLWFCSCLWSAATWSFHLQANYGFFATYFLSLVLVVVWAY